MKTRTLLSLSLVLAFALSAVPAVAAVPIADESPGFNLAALDADVVAVDVADDTAAVYTLQAGEVAPVFVLAPSSEPLLANEPASWRPAAARAVSTSTPGEPLAPGLQRWRT